MVVAACSGAAGTPVPVPPGAVVVTAKDSAFAPADINAPTGASTSGFQLYFDNADATPHDVVFVAADGTRAFQSDTFTGPQQRVYNVKALPAGEYKLVCDIHPEMHGTLTVP
jgi:plastocyanin